MPNTICPVVHFEMPYENEERASRFYENVFGWKLKSLGDQFGRYVVATTATRDVKPDGCRGAIGGGLFPKKPNWPAQLPMVVIGVKDIHQAIQDIEQTGGKVLGEPMEIPGSGLYVVFMDSEGNAVAMLESRMLKKPTKKTKRKKTQNRKRK